MPTNTDATLGRPARPDVARGRRVPVAADDTRLAAQPPAPLRPLVLEPFVAAIEALSDERVAALDRLVLEATIADLQAALTAGHTSAVELTTYYLSRIQALDIDGLRTMDELNPEALEIAQALDAERAGGSVRGDLHGIPLSVKDNISTGDLMHTTAGAAALEHVRAGRDSFVAGRLRAAGAVLLGKANLTEWGNFMHMPGQYGYSALGGQVGNVYDAALHPSGSSAGSAMGTSANLIAASIGTETDGSIVAAAAAAGIVGLKPSLGLVSRDLVIPITDHTDTPGPLTRTVADAAAILTVIAGVDPNDPATQAASSLAGTDFCLFLDVDALRGRRVGFYATGGTRPDLELTDEAFVETIGLAHAVTALRAAGAEVVVIWAEPLDNSRAFTDLGLAGFRDGVAAYLAAVDPGGPVATVSDVVAFNRQDLERYAPFGQGILEAAVDAPAMSREEYLAAGAVLREQARSYIDALLSEHELDILVSSGDRLSSAYAAAGYPAITVPAGVHADEGAIGLTFTGRHLEDGPLIGYAFAYEQAAALRHPPPLARR